MDIKKYIDDYIDWLKKEITFSQIGEYYEINTPFLDNANDYLQIYVKQEGNDIFFTDDGYTINDLRASGINFTSARKQQLIYIINQYGVQLEGDSLVAKSPSHDFAKRKHSFLQCMLRINDMYMLTRSRVSSIFLDDVLDFLYQKEVYPVENIQLSGISGYNHHYDFILPKTRKNSERICLALNNVNRTSVGNVIFSWNDTKVARKPDSKLIVLMNDNNPVNKGAKEAFSNYKINTMLWSDRDKKENIFLLTA